MFFFRKQIQALKFQHKKDVEALINELSELRNFKTDQTNQSASGSKMEQKCSKSVEEKSSKSANKFSFQPIGFVRSCHAAKNGTPRQPSVSSASRGTIDITKMSERFNNVEYSLQNLDEFSHVWIVFVFHLNDKNFVKTKVIFVG